MTGSLGPAGGGDGPDARDGTRDPSRGTPEERLRALGAAGADPAAPHPGHPAGPVPAPDAVGTAEATGARIAAELASLPSPPLPAHVLARIDRALAEERARPAPPGGMHPPRGTRRPRRRVLVPAVAAAVLLVAVVLGVALRPGARPPAPAAAPAPASTAARPGPSGGGGGAPAFRRADLPAALRAGLGAADAGPFSDPRRLAACLRAQPVPAAGPVVGARRVVLDGTPGVLLVLPTGVAARFRLLVVGESCGAEGPATLADTVVGR